MKHIVELACSALLCFESALAFPLPSRFPSDMLVSQYDLLFQRPPRNWQLGIPFGNGDVGILQWGTPEEIFYGINKSDVWDRRFDEKQEVLVDNRTLEMLLDRAPETLKALLKESYRAPTSRGFCWRSRRSAHCGCGDDGAGTRTPDHRL